MPHTKLKVFSVLYIIAGALYLLAALCVVIAIVVGGGKNLPVCWRQKICPRPW